jgi:hypothetical protein
MQHGVKAKIGRVISKSPRLSNLLSWSLSFTTEDGRKKRRARYYEKLHREEFMYKCTRFFFANMIQGDYLEFGCCGGMTFRLASKYAHFHKLNMHLYAFDSFEGLPAPKGIDDHPQWEKGAMSIGIEKFKRILKSAGVKESEYTLIPGYYSDSLPHLLLDKLNLKIAALIYVDCDLYESTVTVLDFVLPLLQTGTIIAFDDFYCFNGDPDRGEQLAWREFLQRNPEIEPVSYLNFGWHGKSFIIKKHDSKKTL